MPELDEMANGQAIDLAIGDDLTIRLPENPTTGYRWEVRSGADTVCLPVTDEYRAPKPTPGAGGVHVWVFRAARRGDVGLVLVYRRPWDEPEQQEKVFVVRLRVA